MEHGADLSTRSAAYQDRGVSVLQWHRYYRGDGAACERAAKPGKPRQTEFFITTTPRYAWGHGEWRYDSGLVGVLMLS